MSPSDAVVQDLDEKHVDLVAKFVSDVRNGKIEGSNNIALATVTLLEQIINESDNTTVIGLCSVVRAAGRLVCGALPGAPCAANMARRVLRALRDEARADGDASLARLVRPAPRRSTTALNEDLREPVREHVAELRTELEGTAAAISSQAKEHVQADEMILTYGASRLTERFLRSARRYRLLLAEGTDVAECHGMAARLSAAGVPVTVLGAAAACAVMSRVNKVVVSVEAALAGGAALGAAGLHAVTAAAKHYGVPVVALCGLHALSPLHARDPAHLNSLLAPHPALPYQMAASGLAHVYAPRHDLIPADNVTLYITNLGGSSPSYIYRLLSELYDPNDYTL
ncbi:translation initiation factor eIF2B subunit beta [Cydia fagiglandana]|uniref:translation initiation factor eIF2B subunit beta n=1 Tax=Cydia fagiglandana TaxID=1458189 RepID=UPI002FEE0998